MPPGVVRPRPGAGRGHDGLFERAVGRHRRVAPEDVLDVHEQQLLVLLLVVYPELDERTHRLVRRRMEEPVHGLVHVGPVAPDVGGPGTGQKTSLGSRMSGADRFVVGVEEEPVGRVERAVADLMGAEQERLEEPTGVGPVPFGRADVGHRLDRLILWREGCGQLLGERPDGLEPHGEVLVLGSAQQIGHPVPSCSPGHPRRPWQGPPGDGHNLPGSAALPPCGAV